MKILTITEFNKWVATEIMNLECEEDGFLWIRDSNCGDVWNPYGDNHDAWDMLDKQGDFKIEKMQMEAVPDYCVTIGESLGIDEQFSKAASQTVAEARGIEIKEE